MAARISLVFLSALVPPWPPWFRPLLFGRLCSPAPRSVVSVRKAMSSPRRTGPSRIRDARPLQDKRADPPRPRGTVELDSARHAATKRGAITSDRVVALARTPARRPRLPSDLDVFVAPRLRAFDAIASHTRI
ncbi:hypothetical protein PVAP13_5KG539814 [Panicum virgatum]|uniref:Uncharacterized protein n=1 Tax=Panicum virgatum TaxID=38727 RepID=A0A8T0SRG0_PANVG|nr:hypothetical protein PVAP13_5KG539814 [Panicum virgatum]